MTRDRGATQHCAADPRKGDRSSLIAAAVFVLAAAIPQTALAQDEERGEGDASSTLGVYRDDDETTVVTSLLNARFAVAEEVVVSAHGLVDAVSSASVDVVSAASTRFTEQRLESGARVDFRAPHELNVGLGVTRSAENDWKSHSFSASVARDVARRNATLSANYALVLNDVGRSGDPTFRDNLTNQTLELGVSQLIDRDTSASLAYTYQHSAGLQSSPYRFVRTTDSMISVAENHPRRRGRHALTIRGLRYLRHETAAEISYRFYRDDWGVFSHTLRGALRYSPGEKWDVRVRGRLYVQSAARFFRKRYDELRVFMSGDRELSSFYNSSIGLKLARHAGALVINIKIDVIGYRFVEFEPLRSRTALVSAAGVGYSW